MKRLIHIHATMTPPHQKLTLRDIDRRDRSERGFARCGYHYVIGRDGRLEVGRPEAQPSMHDDAKHAKQCVSLCLVGGSSPTGEPSNNFTAAQRESLRSFYEQRVNAVGGDVEVNSTVPGLRLNEVRRWLNIN